jgi:hypothetical protein
VRKFSEHGYGDVGESCGAVGVSEEGYGDVGENCGAVGVW